MGSLVKALTKVHIWPNPLSADEVHKSVADFSQDLRSLPCLILWGEGSDHDKCNFTVKIDADIDRLESEVRPSGMDESHLKHMEEQAKK